jgi:hypothetical protein
MFNKVKVIMREDIKRMIMEANDLKGEQEIKERQE